MGISERNTFAAIAFSSYGALWISFVLLIQFFLPEAMKASGMLPANHALAPYLFCWGFFTLYMWFASFRVSLAVNLVLLTLWTLGRTIVPVVPLTRARHTRALWIRAFPHGYKCRLTIS